MSVWITGARGFIGGHLARELAAAGHAVHGIGHGALEAAECKRLGLQSWINGEIEAANLDALAAAHGVPSAVFHLAGGSSVGLAIAHPFEDFSRTVASTARLLEWLRLHSPQTRLIAASSAAVYGSGHSGPISEDAALTPMSPYGQHKLMMEQLCRSYAMSYGIDSTVVRLFSVYGSELRKQLLWDACARLQENNSELVLGGTGEEIRDWCDVRDVVRLLAMVAQLPRGEQFRVINGGSGQPMRVSEVANLLAAHWGNAPVRFSGNVRAGDPFSLLADDAALRATGFAWRVAPAQGIADYVRWFRDRGRG
jgi:UDP-glucose 4-epimerase